MSPPNTSHAEDIHAANDDYIRQALDYVKSASWEAAMRVYHEILHDPALSDPIVAGLAAQDRYFLLLFVLRRSDLLDHKPKGNAWPYERCREVEASPDNHIDLWAREHYKSTFITFGGTMQEVINNPDLTVGIFSHTRPIAKAFLKMIKIEQETNELLPRLWPDIFWVSPRSQAPVWSLDDGIVVMRKGNPKEATWEAWGMVDSMPTSKHFGLIVYNDVVERDSVNTPNMIEKTTDAWELSRNLSAKNPLGPPRTWHEGTRYHYGDTYGIIIKRGVFTARLYPATDDGTPDGDPVLLTPEEWDLKKRESSPGTIACQQLMNPLAGKEREFDVEWFRRWEVRPETLNIAILVDPASSKKKGSSKSAFVVIGMDYARNKYLLDGACHRMNLEERQAMLFGLRKKWIRQPGIQVVLVGYERFGHQTDIEHFKIMMQIEKVSFEIKELSWPQEKEDGTSKRDRIRRLIPDHQNWRFFYPYEGSETSTQREAKGRGRSYLVSKPILRKNEEGRLYNVTEYLLSNEYMFFPATSALDLMDAQSRVYDIGLQPPMKWAEENCYPDPDMFGD
jgi:hypothetical protein